MCAEIDIEFTNEMTIEIKKEIRKSKTLDEFGCFIDSITFYHLKKCLRANCSNCIFIK